MKKTRFLIYTFLILISPLYSVSQNNLNELESQVSELRYADNSFKVTKIIKKCTKMNASYDDLVKIIREGKYYSSSATKGYKEWRYVLDSLDYLSIMYVPNNYTPEKKYPVSIILHGAASTFNTEVVKLYVNRTSYNCDSLTRILVYPGCWIVCPWWREKQTNNLNYVLTKIKQTYNIDENNVHLTGISDGGTGIVYQTNLNITPWASLKPYISHPGGLNTLSDKNIYIKNLGNKPFLFISSERDELFPPDYIETFLDKMTLARNDYKYILAPGYKHRIDWMPIYKDTISEFTKNNTRNPYPNNIYWQTDNLTYNRNHWVIIDKLSYNMSESTNEYPIIKSSKVDPQLNSAIIEVNVDHNIIYVTSKNIKQYTLLLSPEQFDFSKEIEVYTNNLLSYKGKVSTDISVLLKWYNKDLDKSMLFGNELKIKAN